MNKSNYWIKCPFPYDEDGDGVWYKCDTPYQKRMYMKYKRNKKLPTAEQEEMPNE